jgi:hypothetical protein
MSRPLFLFPFLRARSLQAGLASPFFSLIFNQGSGKLQKGAVMVQIEMDDKEATLLLNVLENYFSTSRSGD